MPSIMFLRLRFNGTSVGLVNATIRPGTLKKGRSARVRDGISYQVASASGQVLWSGSVEDPSVRRFEYEDPDHPGQIRTKTVSVDTAEFTVRIPVLKEMENIRFDRRERTEVSRREKYGRQSLGVIVIPRKAEGR